MSICVYADDALQAYNFGRDHPFGPHRLPAFREAFEGRGLKRRACLRTAPMATAEQIEWFHDPDYVAEVRAASRSGSGYLDLGDTPAFPGVFEAAANVVGATLDAVRAVMEGECRRAFVAIGGLHHARRDRAAGFCVFNDCGVAIEALRREHGIRRIAYVDIDAHHGDGVFYAFESDPELFIADIHEDGWFLYPGSGYAAERGQGEAEGTKLNLPVAAGSADPEFYQTWEKVEDFIEAARPEFILFQCGADGLAGDPLTHLRYSPACHRHAAQRLRELAERHCNGRLVALGGGGYDAHNLAQAWCSVIEALIE